MSSLQTETPLETVFPKESFWFHISTCDPASNGVPHNQRPPPRRAAAPHLRVPASAAAQRTIVSAHEKIIVDIFGDLLDNILRFGPFR
jgi:hypothetical protein